MSLLHEKVLQLLYINSKCQSLVISLASRKGSFWRRDLSECSEWPVIGDMLGGQNFHCNHFHG
jgi:hypothetical protein